jgi:diaminohydroxyphosphoribosylaminopyrimidine deaminase/5-amino-6-(5-phosphoribosylamino)uracil reductase
MKYGMTMDGKIATRTGKSKWITNEESRQKVQEFRNELVGIMVGIGTVLADDPMLNCRMTGGRNPIRIVCDSHLRIPLDSRLAQTAKEIPVIVATLEENRALCREKRKQLEQLGVEVLELPKEQKMLSLPALMKALGAKNIDGILLEGGGALNFSMLKAGLVQEVRVFLAPKLFGGREAKTPVEGLGIDAVEEAGQYQLYHLERLGDDIYAKYKRI